MSKKRNIKAEWKHFKSNWYKSSPSDVFGIAQSAQGKENSPPRPDTEQHYAGGQGQSHHQWMSGYSLPTETNMDYMCPLPPTVEK